MRVLLISTPVPTHFLPLTPLGWALRAAGHTVLVAGQPDIIPAAYGAGLSAVEIGERFAVTDLVTQGLPDGQRPVHMGERPTDAQLAAGARVWIMHARYVTEPYLRLARDWAPDLIVSDRLDYASLIVGAVLGIPVVQHRWGVDPIATAAWEPARRTLDGLCRRLGLPDGLPSPAMILDPSPPGMRVAGVVPGVPIRPVPSNGSAVAPAWALRRERRFRVCVSLGWITLELNGVPLLRNVLEACASLPDTETVATVQPEFRERLGTVPGAVRVIDPLPIDLLLGSCDAVVHHGGSGTAMASAVFGLPQLALPQYLDAFHVGDGLTATGTGISLDEAKRQDNPEEIADAVGRLLTEPGFRTAAGSLRDAVAAMPSPARTVDVLRRLVGA